MKFITKFLLAVFCLSPVAHAAPVATTAGSNLTGYNGAAGSVAGNNWNNMMNPRSNTQSTSAKADYGNCNSVILRCATPKCSGGGCSDINVAKSIVSGCVSSNATCKKHGDALVDFVAAQLVSDSIATQNQQAAAAQAAQAAAEQNAQAMQQQMASMQQQMASMQQQNSQQISSLQQQLAESQRATESAVAAAAENAARAASTPSADTGLTAAQENAVKSGVDAEVVQRATISGQVLTNLEGVESSLDKLKTTMRDAFRYAGCNEINGDNCEGPKRVKKFRELANKFFEPYDALENNLEDALSKAEFAGIDLGNIYMYFSGSCNRWAEYVCRYQLVAQDTLPVYNQENSVFAGTCDEEKHISKSVPGVTRGGYSCGQGVVILPEDLVGCTVNRYLDPTKDDITEAVLNPDATETGSIRVGCASDIGSRLNRHRRSSGKGKSGIDIDLLKMLINQHEGSGKFEKNKAFCGLGVDYDSSSDADDMITALRGVTVSKALKPNGHDGCCSEKPEERDKCKVDCYDMDQDVEYVDPIFALCDTHAWNIGMDKNDELKSETTEGKKLKNQMNEIIGLKTTIIAQQMYKQYTSMEKMIKQIKIMLEKEVLKANLQVAGGASSSSDSAAEKVEFENCGIKVDDTEVINCLRGNLAKYDPFVTKGNTRNDVRKSMKKDADVIKSWRQETISDCTENMNKDGMTKCYSGIAKEINAWNKEIKDEDRDKKLIEAIYKRGL